MNFIKENSVKFVIASGLLFWLFAFSHPSLKIQSIVDAATPLTISVGEHSLRQDMRKLFEERVFWEKAYISDYIAGNIMAEEDLHRLAKSNLGISDIIKGYYGDEAGFKVSAFLQQHTNSLKSSADAAKDNDLALMESVNLAWYNNDNQLADYLASLNPNWKQGDMRLLWKEQIDLVKRQLVDMLEVNVTDVIEDYDKVHDAALQLSDALSSGLVKQFPDRF